MLLSKDIVGIEKSDGVYSLTFTVDDGVYSLTFTVDEFSGIILHLSTFFIIHSRSA